MRGEWNGYERGLTARPEDEKQQRENGEADEENKLRAASEAMSDFGSGVFAISGEWIVSFRAGEDAASAGHHLHCIRAGALDFHGLAGSELAHGAGVLATLRRVLEHSAGRDDDADVVEDAE